MSLQFNTLVVYTYTIEPVRCPNWYDWTTRMTFRCTFAKKIKIMRKSQKHWAGRIAILLIELITVAIIIFILLTQIHQK